jgi:hypothetical protein
VLEFHEKQTKERMKVGGGDKKNSGTFSGGFQPRLTRYLDQNEFTSRDCPDRICSAIVRKW